MMVVVSYLKFRPSHTSSSKKKYKRAVLFFLRMFAFLLLFVFVIAAVNFMSSDYATEKKLRPLYGNDFPNSLFDMYVNTYMYMFDI